MNISACGTTAEKNRNQSDAQENEQIDVIKEAAVDGNSNGNILIAYFSWADNTVVKDEESSVESALSHYESIGDRENYDDVDAVTSASILRPGNTEKMAQWIQEYVGGDLFPIVVTDPYPDNYDECMEFQKGKKRYSFLK